MIRYVLLFCTLVALRQVCGFRTSARVQTELLRPRYAHLSRDVEILFLPTKTSSQARVGTPLEEVAKAAGVDINYKCKKGECGTCEVKIDGKWVRACQYRVPAAEMGDQLRITVRPKAETEKKKPAKFFSPASFVEGVVNNGLGVVGFVTEALKVDDEFDERMQREKELQAKLEARKAQRSQSA